MNRVRSLTRLFSDVFDDIYFPETSSWTYRGQWVDLDKYEVRPKKEYYETLVKRKEDEIRRVEERLSTLKEEKETLLKERKALE